MAVSEVKFLVALDDVEPICQWARARLLPDPFGGGPAGDTYHTTSLYFDTREFDVFHRRGSYGRCKYRIRRYGQTERVFLERKLKTYDTVKKRRSIVRLAELCRLRESQPECGWDGYWFHRRVLARELRLVCQISYRRLALIGTPEQGAIRLTLDQDLRAVSAADLEFRPPSAGTPLGATQAILELKYDGSAPPVFEELIGNFRLSPQPVSKYRTAVATLGLAGGRTLL